MAWAQTPPATPTTPATDAAQPVPVDELPPLNLPELPGERDRPAERNQPEIPAPPPPLPMPQGPAVVKAGIRPTGERHFKLYYSGQWIGWSKFRVTGEMKLGNTDAVIISSLGEIRVGFGGIAPAQFESRLMLDRNTLRPAYFKCVQAAGGDSFEVECIYSESMVAQTNRTGDSRTVHFQDFTDQAPQLVFNNLWGHIDTFPEHYWLMVRSAVQGGVVEAYDPILRGAGEVIVYEPTTADYLYDGRNVKAKVYPISDLRGTLLARVKVAAESFELLEVEEIGSGLKMVRTDPGIEKRLSQLKGLDLAQSRIIPSNVVFPDPEQLTALEADVEIGLRGGQLADHRIPGYRQYFTGELSEGRMKGRVFVRSVPREVPFDSPYPLERKHVDPELLPLLNPGPGLEVEYPPLATKAREIAWKSPNSFEAAKRLNSFVTDIEEGVSLPSARYALESGVGNPESKALLMVAMSRAVGLPARKISGVAFRDGDWIPHHWVEVWLSKTIGWTPFDPSSGEAGRVGAAHIALLDSGDIQSLDIRVTDYAPRATKRVPYIAQELKWDQGERRVYGVYKDGEKVGTETAEMGDLEFLDGEEVFRFTARSEIRGPGGLQVTTAEQLLNPNGLPRQIILSFKDANKDESTTYRFLEDTVLLRTGQPGTEAYEKDRGREFPFAKGTYFTDPRLLSQWALMAGQVPLTVGSEKEFPVHVYLPERKESRELLLEVGEVESIRLESTLKLVDDGAEEKADPETPPSEEPPTETESAPTGPPAAPSEASEEQPANAALDPELATSQTPQEQLAALTPNDPNALRATHLILDSGMELWLNDKNQIIKIDIPDQGLELILEKVETRSIIEE